MHDGREANGDFDELRGGTPADFALSLMRRLGERMTSQVRRRRYANRLPLRRRQCRLVGEEARTLGVCLQRKESKTSLLRRPQLAS